MRKAKLLRRIEVLDDAVWSLLDNVDALTARLAKLEKSEGGTLMWITDEEAAKILSLAE